MAADSSTFGALSFLMWANERGYNTIRPEDPGLYLSPALQKAIDALTDKQKVELDIAMDLVIEKTFDTLDREFVTGDEASFAEQALPGEFALDEIGPDETLPEGLARQIDEVPLRWRLETARLIGYYVSDRGPNFRRYKRLLKQLRKVT